MTIESLLGELQTSASTTAGKILIVYGPPGVGKTSLLAQFPQSVLIEVKDFSSDSLKSSGSIPADLPVLKKRSFDEAVEALEALAEGGHGFKNIILDGASGMESYLNAEVLSSDFENNPVKFTQFGNGEKVAGVRWASFVGACIDLQEKGYRLFITAHAITVTKKNAMGSDYLRNAVDLHKDKLAPFSKYVDATLFIDLVTGEYDKNKVSGVAKVTSSDERIMYCNISHNYDAKNRLGLPAEINLGSSPEDGYKAFLTALKNGKKGK